MSYWMLVGVTLVIGLGVTANVNHQLKKYSQVGSAAGMTGAQIAQAMLRAHGVSGVEIHRGTSGENHFDPRTNSITLDPSSYEGSTVTAIATACHEAGHACQFAESYAPMKARSAIAPVVGVASNAWIFLLIIGIFLQMFSLMWLAIIVYALVVLFQIVTLPVEFDASRRAMVYITNQGAPAVEIKSTGKVLRACALTYVAAALTSILQLLWIISQTRR